MTISFTVFHITFIICQWKMTASAMINAIGKMENLLSSARLAETALSMSIEIG
jgi:hypothetical protein